MKHNIQAAAVAAAVSMAIGAGGATAAQHLFIAKGSVDHVKLSAGLNKERASNLARLSALEKKAGIPGPSGKDGSNGTNGAKGDTGTAGAQGAKGDAGAKGEQGVQGVPGPTGATGPQGAPGADGHDAGLPAGFAVTNKSVSLTKSGVDFGPYSDGGAAGGSLYFDGFNGQKLSDLTELAYTVRHTTSDGSAIAVPYLRVFLNGDTTDVVLDPTECATKVPAEDTDNTFSTADTTVRYDDDACGADAHQVSFADAVAAHGDDVISGIYVTAGFAGGADLHAVLTGLSVNGQAFTFGG